MRSVSGEPTGKRSRSRSEKSCPPVPGRSGRFRSKAGISKETNLAPSQVAQLATDAKTSPITKQRNRPLTFPGDESAFIPRYPHSDLFVLHHMRLAAYSRRHIQARALGFKQEHSVEIGVVGLATMIPRRRGQCHDADKSQHFAQWPPLPGKIPRSRRGTHVALHPANSECAR